MEIGQNSYCFQIAFDVSDVPAPRTSRVLAGLVDHVFDQAVVVEYAFPDDLEADDMGTLFKDVRRRWRHGSRQDATDISVVPARCSKEDDLLFLIVKYRTDDGDIGQVTIMH